MLVTTRKEGEKVYFTIPGIGTVSVEIAEADGGYARLNIDAPKRVKISWDEPNPLKVSRCKRCKTPKFCSGVHPDYDFPEFCDLCKKYYFTGEDGP